ncbi:restriction endonuclease subunit S [Idiomarina abyssalis]|uniref:restriction endonuclease subunit S n=1 Tax=Idiomarina abyssalis TaxID=86102 RepID=UPI003A8CC102
MRWKTAALADLADVFNGKTPSKKEQRDRGHPVLKIKDVNEDSLFKGSFESFCEPELADKFENKRIKLNDTLILNAAHNSDYVGSKQYCAEQAVVNALPTGEWLVVRANNKDLQPRFLNYWLKSPQTRFQIKQLVKGIHLYPKDVARLKISLPPIEEQKRIVSILDMADAIRRKRQQAIQFADDFLRSAFLDMFGDPVTNTKGWEIKPLGEVSTFENGDRSSNYPSGEDIVKSGVLFLSTKNIVYDTLDLKKIQFITRDKFSSLSRGKVQKGDLIITLRGTLGACCIFDCEYEQAFINAQMMIIRPHDSVKSTFLHDLLVSKAIKAHLQSLGQGGAVPQLTANQLKELRLPIPSIDEQVKYEAARKVIFGLLDKMPRSTNRDLFDSLSQKAFSGLI